jgi:hypothetical protein
VSFEVVSYRTDSMAVVDSFVMVKSAAEGRPWLIIVILLAIAAVLGLAAAFINKRGYSSGTRNL